jgi:two-component system response regulator PilR (NtrC family)
VRHFLRQVAEEQGIPEKKISTEAMRLLEAHPWPGNVRELENLIERTVALEPGTIITTASLPESFLKPAGVPSEALETPFDLPFGNFSLEDYLKWIGRRLMMQALERSGGVQAKAAKLLGMTPRSFRYYAKTYELRRDEEEDPYDEPGPPVEET